MMIKQRSAYVFGYALTFLTCVSARAVNISNTWMLPEEGFPVFYRYFRDRISWYEADAVCQFHHANLVTVDNTSQFDAVRAFLKELDISSNVWIGLTRNSEKAQFTWSDFQPLTNEGYWQEAIPEASESICAAIDPAADFRWHGLSCGGPDVASFICELPVPKWATDSGGCFITELPSLTILYVPEQSAVELISDCGLDGTRQIACKGNANREEMMKQLSCGELDNSFDEKSTKSYPQSNPLPDTPFSLVNTPMSTETKTTKHWTSNTVDVDDYHPTRHRRETDNTISSYVTKSTLKIADESNLKVENATTSHVFLRGDTVDEEQRVPLTKNNKENKDTSSFTTGSTIYTAKEPSTAQESSNEYNGVINQGQLFSILDNATLFDIVDLNETDSEENGSIKEYLLTTEQHGQKLTRETTTAKNIPSEPAITTVLYHKEPPQDEMPVTNKDIKKISKKDIIETQTSPTNRTYEDSFENNQTDIGDSDSKTSLDKKVEFAIYQASKSYRAQSINDQNSKSKETELFPIATNPNMKLNRTYRKQLPSPTKFPKKYLQNSTMKNSNDKSFRNLKNKQPETQEINEHIILDGNKEHKVVEIKLHSPEKENITKLVITTKRIRDQIENVQVPNITTIREKDTNTPTFFKNDEAEAVLNLEQKTTTTATEATNLNNKKQNKAYNQEGELAIPNFNFTNITATTEERNLTKVYLQTQQSPLKLDSIEQETEKEFQSSVNKNKLENKEQSMQGFNSEESESEMKKNILRNRKVTKPRRKSYYPFFIGRVIG